MKQLLKYIVTFVVNSVYRLDLGKNVYLGYLTNFRGGKRIHIGDNAVVSAFASIIIRTKHGVVEIGKNSLLGLNSMIGCNGHIKICNDVTIAQNVFISDASHGYSNINIPILKQSMIYVPTLDGNPNIVVGEGTWVGRNVCILGNVKIGRNCVIGANSIVNKDIPDYSVAVGAPAKVIKRYDLLKKEWVKIK